MFKNKDKINIELILEPWKKQVKFLEQKVASLESEKTKLLDAILSVKAPEAYKEMKEDQARASIEPELTEEEKRIAKIKQETIEKYMESLEGPLFKGAEDFDVWLNSVLAPGIESKPLNYSDES